MSTLSSLLFNPGPDPGPNDGLYFGTAQRRIMRFTGNSGEERGMTVS